MGGLFVLGRGIGSPIDLHQDKSIGVILLLDHVEPGNSRLLYTIAGIFDGGFDKGVQIFRLHRDMNVYDEHVILLWYPNFPPEV
jgi:hypothetical protein